MQKLFIVIAGVIFIGALIAGAIYFGQQKSQPKGLTFVTSFYPLYFFTKEIVGDKATVINITPAGVEPHDYELSARDRALLEDATVVFINGNRLESWGSKVPSAVVVGSNFIGNDPHIWFDPKRAISMVDKITETLSQKNPQNAAYYSQNASQLKNKLAQLEQEYAKRLTSCKKKEFVTSHEAFGYLARSYGLTAVPLVGLSPEQEPSPKQIATVVDFIKKNNVQYVFSEELSSPKYAETIAKETGAKILSLNPIEGLTPEGEKNGENYLTIMQQNLKNLQQALECTP